MILSDTNNDLLFEYTLASAGALHRTAVGCMKRVSYRAVADFILGAFYHVV